MINLIIAGYLAITAASLLTLNDSLQLCGWLFLSAAIVLCIYEYAVHSVKASKPRYHRS